MSRSTLESHFQTDVLEAIVLSNLKTNEIKWDIATVDELGETLNKAASLSAFDLSPQDYWADLKAEFCILVCSDDERYRDLKKKLSVHGKRSQTALVSTIAVFIGSEVGVEAGVLTPYCALLLGMLLKLGKEAFCRGVSPS